MQTTSPTNGLSGNIIAHGFIGIEVALKRLELPPPVFDPNHIAALIPSYQRTELFNSHKSMHNFDEIRGPWQIEVQMFFW